MKIIKKFKPYQEIIALNFNINGKIVDAMGRFIRYCTNPHSAGKIEIEINTVRIYTTEDKIVCAEEYWKNKKGDQQ